MDEVTKELISLFDEAKQKSEFDFVLTLINYTGMGEKELSTNLHEWFDAIEFYKGLYHSLSGKERTRIGVLLYSAFFENSDFYNIIVSLCRIRLGFKGSSYLFWKTRKYEKFLGIGEKQGFLTELLDDAGKPNIISFFDENHHKPIRNTFFHSAYSLDDENYILHDSDPIIVDGIGTDAVNVEKFLYPEIENVIALFDAFKAKYLESFASYKTDKEINGRFPNPVNVTVLGSATGLKGFRIKNSVQFYGTWHDSGIWYDEQWGIWAGHNIRMYFDNIETIELQDQLSRHEAKKNINRSDAEFQNLIDKIAERRIRSEMARATLLLQKFGDVRYSQMADEENPRKKQSLYPGILHFYNQAIELGKGLIDIEEMLKKVEELNQK